MTAVAKTIRKFQTSACNRKALATAEGKPATAVTPTTAMMPATAVTHEAAGTPALAHQLWEIREKIIKMA